MQKTKINKRLVTSGCSCTAHCWPTWPDYLGQAFEDYINVGIGGADNANIARTVLQTAEPGDTVVVTWSGFDRFNTFNESKSRFPNTSGSVALAKYTGQDVVQKSNVQFVESSGSWEHKGSVVSDKLFFTEFYNRIERFRTTIDYVNMLEMHSKIVGYELYNFSAFPWYTGECELEIDDRIQKMINSSMASHFYYKSNLELVRSRIADIVVKHKYSNEDSHPTPLVQWHWAKYHIATELGIELPDLTEQVAQDQQNVLNGIVI